MNTNENNQSELGDEGLRREAKRRGKASFHTWLSAQTLGKDPDQYEQESAKRYREKMLAYSAYVRYDGRVSSDQSSSTNTGGARMSQVAFTLDDIKKLLDERFTTEREHTRTMIQEEVKEGVGELRDEFQSFINDNFDPTMKKFDLHFDRIEDHLDRLDIDVATLRTDVRHIKQTLNIPGEQTKHIVSPA